MFSVVAFPPTEKFQVFMTLRQEEEGACEDEEGRKRKSCGSALHYRGLREHDLCDWPLWTGARVTTDGETQTPCRLQSEPWEGAAKERAEWQRRPQQSLPGANARHKSSISLQSDFQSCRNGIIKIDAVGESVPAVTRLAFLTAPTTRVLCPPGFAAGIPSAVHRPGGAPRRLPQPREHWPQRLASSRPSVRRWCLSGSPLRHQTQNQTGPGDHGQVTVGTPPRPSPFLCPDLPYRDKGRMHP